MYKAPKTITKDSRVEFCDDAQALGFDEDLIHDVGLKTGWVFDFHEIGRTNMRFKTVREFKQMRIIKEAKQLEKLENV